MQIAPPSATVARTCGRVRKGIRVPIALEQDTQSSTIRLEGAVDIGGAVDLKEALLRVLATSGDVRVVLDEATDLDVTAMQLLWAAQRTARESGRQFKITGGMPGPIAAALAEAGIELL